jgi:uncharacterized protein
MTPDLCLYHANCDDGFGAAFAVWKRFGDSVKYLAVNYGHPPPEVTDLDIVIVDFSYKRPVMIEMAENAKTILVLDHHKTAQAELDGIERECLNTKVVFDMNRSGAVMAWEHFHPESKVPDFFLYLQDRDLWTKKLPRIDEFTFALRSYPYHFLIWDKLYNYPTADLIAEGEAIHRYFRKLVDEAKTHAFFRDIAGHRVPVVNASMFLASEVAGELSEDYAFAAVYVETENTVIWSLRSRMPDGLDVSEIAKRFGGGGHKHAAGFTVPRS